MRHLILNAHSKTVATGRKVKKNKKVKNQRNSVAL